MPTDRDQAIEDIIASCNGDLRGAILALLLVNERLEIELQQICATQHAEATLQPTKENA